MNLSFAEHRIELHSWDTKKEMLDFLGRSEGSLVLGENNEQEVEFYSATVHITCSKTDREAESDIFAIGICSQGLGLKPQLLLLPQKELLIFGFNSETVGINLKREVVFRITFDRLPFRSLIHLWQQQVVLALHEIGVVALTEEGKEVWRYSKDVLTGCTINLNQLHLAFMDSSPVTLNILTGKEGPPL